MFMRHVWLVMCVVAPWVGWAEGDAATNEPAKPPAETPDPDAVAQAQTRVAAAQTNVAVLSGQLDAATTDYKAALSDPARAAERTALSNRVEELTGKLALARTELEGAQLAVVVASRSKTVHDAEAAVKAAQEAVAKTQTAITSNRIERKYTKKEDRAKLDKEHDLLQATLKGEQAALAQAQAALDSAKDAHQGALALKTAQEMGVPASMPEIYESLRKSSAALPAQYVFLQAGFLSLNPYRITGKDGGLVMETSGDADVRPYVEATFRHRTAWLDKQAVVFADHSLPLAGTNNPGVLNWLAELLDSPFRLLPGEDDPTPVGSFVNAVFGEADLVPRDYEVHVGLVGGVGEDEASAPTVAGAGDGYVEGSLGWRLWTTGFDPKDGINNGNLRMTFNLEALGGMTTDREFQDVHDYRAVGLATVWGIKNNQDKNPNHNTELIAGLYWGQLEVPQLAAESDIPDELKGQKVVVGRNGDVDFSNEKATLIRVDMHVPAGDEGYFIVSGRYWTGLADIEPWTLGVGYSFPIDGK